MRMSNVHPEDFIYVGKKALHMTSPYHSEYVVAFTSCKDQEHLIVFSPYLRLQ